MIYILIILAVLGVGLCLMAKGRNGGAVEPAAQQSISTIKPDDEYAKKRAELDARIAQSDEMERKYGNTIEKHNALVDQIGKAYSVAKQAYGYLSPEMERVIELCLDDITLAPAVLERNHEWDRIYGDGKQHPEHYDTYKRLAIIYEKRKEYQNAADVCKQAMDNGVTSDGTEGGYPGRYAKMVKLASTKLTSGTKDNQGGA